MTGDRALAAESALGDLSAAIAVTETIVAGISAGQWGAPTPCAGVDVRALVNHLVAGNLHFAALVHGTPRPDGDADLLGAEPAEAFRAAAAGLTTALSAPGVLDRRYPLPFGEVPGLGLIEIRLIEHLGHGWDLARATGQPALFPDDLAERGLSVARRQVENRTAGGNSAFGAEVQVSPAAPAIDRLAGFLGRAV
ncbi:MAG: TIGR03086 family metal-binding protein [Trebonia sp.]